MPGRTICVNRDAAGNSVPTLLRQIVSPGGEPGPPLEIFSCIPHLKNVLAGADGRDCQRKTRHNIYNVSLKKSAGEYFCEKIYHFHNSLGWVKEKRRGSLRKYKLETDKSNPNQSI